MDISLVTPAGKRFRSGNRTTAERWAAILRGLGHRVAVADADEACDADMMVAIHAWRSAASIARFASCAPGRPLVVCLAGTDVYSFQHSHPAETLASMEAARALVGLHDLVHLSIPERFRRKLRVIHQSAPPLAVARRPSARTFDVCVVAQLRAEKDPLRAAYAARLMPETSRLRVVLLGRAHDRDWADKAGREARTNPRLAWRGEVAPGVVRRYFRTCRAMAITSVMEGGANVVSEAVAAGLPVIASAIDGNLGLLGKDYEGTFPAGDTEALAAALRRAETEPAFLARLEAQCRARAHLFAPERERAAWQGLIADLAAGTPAG